MITSASLTGWVVVLAAAAGAGAAELPSPKTGGAGGSAVALLVLSDDGGVDARYEKELAAAGYRLSKCSFTSRLSAEYLRQFNVVVLTRLPFAGEKYQVGGERLAPLADNIKLLREYLEAGGGVLFEPAMSEFGEAYAQVYNRFLEPYGAAVLPQQLRDDAETKGAYAAGQVLPAAAPAGDGSGGHPITEGLKDVLYPIHVLRWDHAYSTTPIIVGKDWTVLAAGAATAGSHQAIDNSNVGPRLSDHRDLLAVRAVGKGRLAASAVHSYYTLTHAYSPAKNLGENDTGVIDGIVLNGEPSAPAAAGRPSDFGKLLDRTYRYLAAGSAAAGFGGKEVPLPAQPPRPAVQAAIDWHTAQPPPTWQHRVMRAWAGDTATYDELPDPDAAGELKFFKALIGPRSAASSGSGTVAEWRDAARKAGYSAVMFAETFADLDAAKWAALVRDCDAASDESFACLPGMDIQDDQGGRYLVLGARRFPDPTWLSKDGKDGKKLHAIRMLSLGWFGHVASVHRAGRTQLHPMMYKHYQGITVYTYDRKGKQIDDALHAYQWAISSDSNPIPIAAHELESPADVPAAATAGFQQVLPGVSLAAAVDYFRFALPHYFDCPLRYFISEGPVLSGWSIRNKDIGDRKEGRDHWRLGIAVRGEAGGPPIAEATLYDGLDVFRRWRGGSGAGGSGAGVSPSNPGAAPVTPSGAAAEPARHSQSAGDGGFRATVDGFHDAQREFMLLAADAKGRRVLSPGIRTVTRNWRLRCGDRQNWLGSLYIYTGWMMAPFGNYQLPLRNTREGGSAWIADGGGNPCVIFDFPYFSNHVQVMDVDVSTRYTDAGWEDIGGDAKGTFAVRPADFAEGRVRTTAFVPKTPKLAAARVDVWIRLKRDVEPDPRGPVWPVLAQPMGKNELLLLPGQPPRKLADVKAPVDLPAGSYVGGIITLDGSLLLDGRNIGLPAPAEGTLTLPKGKTFEASYLVLKTGSFLWTGVQTGYETDALAPAALAELGLAAKPPFALELTRGQLEGLAHTARLTAEAGGVAGRCTRTTADPLLLDVPLSIRGLNPRCQSAVWRADRDYLEYFSCFHDEGLVTLDADKPVDFYAGNIATCDSALFVEVVAWNATEAHFRLNNPTPRDITTTFETASAVRGFKPLRKEVTVPAGKSVEVRE
jgi:hypothetical protein